MSKDLGKWLFTFTLLLLTIGWAVFSALITWRAMAAPTPINVMEVAGVNVLLGALITWCSNVNQFWFRKKNPEEGK